MSVRSRAAIIAAPRPCTWGNKGPGSAAMGAADFILHTSNQINTNHKIRFEIGRLWCQYSRR
jgi:hypothetical protein